MVELLLKRQADASSRNKRGETVAQLCKDLELRELLEQAQQVREAFSLA